MNVIMKNRLTGELKSVKVGWSWILFLFSGFFGLPLFLRKLTGWALIFLALAALSVFFSFSEHIAVLSIYFIINMISLGLSIYLGINGNEITVRHYLNNGWVFENPESDATKFAKAKWNL